MTTRICIPLTLSLLALATTPAYAADNASASSTIAGVLLTLNHFPSAADKEALAAVAGDDGVGRGMRLIAEAVANIQHSATEQDREIMNRIIASQRASARAKALAQIVLDINHAPDAAARSALEAMR